MSRGQINKIGVAVPFKGNTKNKEKNGSSAPFIAGAAAIGAVAGAKSPESLIIKEVSDVTPKNLKKILSDSAKYAGKSLTQKQVNLNNALNSALKEISGFFTKKGQKITGSAIAGASLFNSENLVKLQEKNFNNLKNLIPKEPVLHSAAKGAALAGSIAVGLVVMSKIFPDAQPAEFIYNDPYDYKIY